MLELARDIDQSLILSALMVPGMPVEDVRPWTGSLDPADFPMRWRQRLHWGVGVLAPLDLVHAGQRRANPRFGLAVLPWTVNEVADPRR